MITLKKDWGNEIEPRKKVWFENINISPRQEEMCSGILTTTRVLQVQLKGKPFNRVIIRANVTKHVKKNSYVL